MVHSIRLHHFPPLVSTKGNMSLVARGSQKCHSLGAETAGSLEKRVQSWNQLFQLVPISDLVTFQRTSFLYFSTHGLREVIQKKNKILFSTPQGESSLSFFPEYIQFRKPDSTPKQAQYGGKTYGCSVYIPVTLNSPCLSHQRLEWVLLGFLPVLTQQGHFIINGISRVVLHQLVRNPGVYLRANDSQTRGSTIRIVPQQGSWINITVDKQDRFWVTTGFLKRKVSLLIFLQALGFSLSTIYQISEDAEILKSSIVKPLPPKPKRKKRNTRQEKILVAAGLHEHPSTQEEAWRYLYAHYKEYSPQVGKRSDTLSSAQAFFWHHLWNAKNLQLGKRGREQFRTKLHSPVPETELRLLAIDLLSATRGLLDFLVRKRLPDDLDSLTNKHIRGCGEFLENELIRSLREFEAFFLKKFSGSKSFSEAEFTGLWRLNRTYLSHILSKAWKSFFTSGTLSQYMDQTNPLAELTHKRRLTVLGPGGLGGKQTTIQIRGINSTFYGRLCPIETPEGKNAGLVNSFTVYTRRTVAGKIETPYYHVYKGQVQKFLPPAWLTPENEKYARLAPADLFNSNWCSLPKTDVPVRIQDSFEHGSWKQISHQSVDLLQVISIAASLIPFLEHDDANRALMGSNMQRQSVPLLRPERALIGTGLESRVISDVHHGILASKAAYITCTTARQIQVYQPRLTSLPLSKLKHIVSDFLKTTEDSQIFNVVPHLKNVKAPQPKNAATKLFQLTSQFRGFECPAYVKQNKFAFLTNAQQFEKKPKFSFLQGQLKKRDHLFSRLESEKRKQDYVLESLSGTNQSTMKLHRPCIQERQWIQKTDIVADGAASKNGKVALGKNVFVAYLPWEGYNFEDAILISERLVNQDVYTSLHIDYYDVEVINTQYGVETITPDIPFDFDGSEQDFLQSEQLNALGLVDVGKWVEEGDYLVGKVTPLGPKTNSVENQYQKLFNKIMERETTDFRNTSLRVPKGIEGFVLGVEILPPKQVDILALVPEKSLVHVRITLLQRRKIRVGDKMAGRHGNKGVISRVLPVQDMPYLPDGTPMDIVLNPLGVPSRMNVGQILESLLGLAAKYLHESYTITLFDEKFGAEASRSFVYSKLYQASVQSGNPWLFEPEHAGKIRLYDGRTGRPFDQAVTVGYSYMLKLIHLVDDKIHVRTTGPYSTLTQQPVKGRAKNGGQRLGEMEVWALQAYGAAALLQEFLTIKSDDVIGRKQTIFQIYTRQPISAHLGQAESFHILLRELESLCFNMNFYEKECSPSLLQSRKREKSYQSLDINDIDQVDINKVKGLILPSGVLS